MGIMGYVPVDLMAFAAGLGLLAALVVAAPRIWRKDVAGAARVMAMTLLVGAGVVVGLATLARPTGVEVSMNLHPGAGIEHNLNHLNPSLGVANIIGGVALFLPLGMLIRWALSWGLLSTVSALAAASVALEALQLAVGRAADIDDVILNTAGALIGWVLAALAVKAAAGVLTRFGRVDFFLPPVASR